VQLDFLTENWEIILWALPGVWAVILLVVILALPRVDFRVVSNAVVVECMGYVLRKIPLSDIARISKRLKGKPEVWRNTLRGNHRMLVLYRKSGKRPIVITPHNRYVFRNQLETSLKQLVSQTN
jgi:hypothetical protein